MFFALIKLFFSMAQATVQNWHAYLNTKHFSGMILVSPPGHCQCKNSCIPGSPPGIDIRVVNDVINLNCFTDGR